MAIARAVRPRRARHRQRHPDRARDRRSSSSSPCSSASGRPRTPSSGSPPLGLLVLTGLAVSWLSVALGHVDRQRRDGQQPADDPDPAAVPRARRSCRRRRCPARSPGSRSTSRSRRSSRPCGACSSARRSATTGRRGGVVRGHLDRGYVLGAAAVRARAGADGGRLTSRPPRRPVPISRR